jgi:hypothetical protein
VKQKLYVTTKPWELSFDFPCLECHPLGVGDLVFRLPPVDQAIDSSPVAVNPFGTRPASSAISTGARQSIVDALGQGQQLVSAAEPLGVVETSQPGRMVSGAVFVDRTNSTPTLSLEVASLSGSILARPLGAIRAAGGNGGAVQQALGSDSAFAVLLC